MPFAVTAAASIFETVAKPLFTLLCSGADRGAVTGKGKMSGVNKAAFNGTAEKLLVVKLKDQPEGIPGFQIPAFQ